MKKIASLIVFTTIVISCSKSVSEQDLQHLNGYWEISEVKTPDNDTKVYQSNNNADYFVLNDQNGTRSKVVVQLDGTIQSNGIHENFTVKDSVGALYLKYQTEFSQWTEKVEQLTEDELIIINDNNIKYIYKRFTPITINE
ncbi:MAG TPA: lipocalin family protein [Flavobacterium sp.]|nr:lipocalin family protein [Flavobacterium sp.]